MTAKYRALRSKVFELCKQSKYAEAIALCQTKIEEAKNKGESVGTISMIPYILHHQGRLSECKEALQSIIDADELDRGSLYHLLEILILLGDFEHAIATADRLIEVDAKFPFQSFTASAYFHKAYAAWKLGRFKQAKAALDKSDEKGSIWIDRHLLSREHLASSISRRRVDPA
ncbi:hypothetical protein G5V57_00125 [Nordella sp. HKS 07]|uniref:tetratricopeptide repeat protein n=1 Tax=Nordella sp. HKS 07 TaxID=2712222 RepID=UPI0013E1E942|nr:hypothetical protein [Nordella sp. HKS 07]QIG46304.1 hypothetical protein G5V57_00125 [Nordella sp. HKS 07]